MKILSKEIEPARMGWASNNDGSTLFPLGMLEERTYYLVEFTAEELKSIYDDACEVEPLPLYQGWEREMKIREGSWLLKYIDLEKGCVKIPARCEAAEKEGEKIREKYIFIENCGVERVDIENAIKFYGCGSMEAKDWKLRRLDWRDCGEYVLLLPAGMEPEEDKPFDAIYFKHCNDHSLFGGWIGKEFMMHDEVLWWRVESGKYRRYVAIEQYYRDAEPVEIEL